MFVYIQSFLVVMLEILCCKIFFETFGVRRAERNIWKNIGIIFGLMLVMYFTVIFLGGFLLLKQAAIIVVMAAFMTGYLEIGFIKSLLLSALFQGMVLVVDYFAYLLNVFMFDGMPAMTETYPIEGILLIALGKAILFLIVIIIRRHMGKDSLVTLADTEWLRFIFFPIFTICTIAAIIVTSGGVRNRQQEELFFVIAMGLAGMNMIVFNLIKDIIKRESEIRENEMLALQAKHQISMRQSIMENLDKQRRRTHEYRNQILCIESMLDKKNYEELDEYVKGIGDGLNRERDSFNTNNVVVNAIINAKYQEMVAKGIVFVFKFNDLSGLPITDEDTVIILSNLLDNAIEACEDGPEMKVIKFKFVKEEKEIIISAKNTHKNKIICQEERIRTSKKENVEEHGIGIRNIVETVTKYGGDYVIQDDGHEFYFSIVIPCRELR